MYQIENDVIDIVNVNYFQVTSFGQPCETTIPDRPELRFTNYQRHYILL